MNASINFLVAVFAAFQDLLLDAAPFMLLGSLAAALVQEFLPTAQVVRHLGGRGAGAVFRAALLGIPLPL